MSRKLKKLPASFYQLASGKEPVRDWLAALPKEDRMTIGLDIAMAEYGWPIGMPLCRSLGDGLWEIRSNLPSHKIARVIFCVVDKNMVLLHGFIKKTQKTPAEDLTLAKKRKKEIET
jgi:phage-related protein